MSDTSQTPAPTFFGIPIEGSYEPDKIPAQLTEQQVRDLLEPVIRDDRIVEIGWYQYLPSYNDGEPCEFSVGGLWVHAAGQEVETCPYCKGECDCGDEPDLFEWNPYDPDSPLGYRKKTGFDEENRTYEYTYEGPDQGFFEQVGQLMDALESGRCDSVLRNQFGYNVRIRLNRQRVALTEYGY